MLRAVSLLSGASVLLASCLSAQPASSDAEKAVSPAVSTDAAKQLLERGRLPEALAQLDELAKQAPEPPGVERLRGITFYQQARLSDAEGAFTKAVSQDRNDTEAVQMLGVTLYREGRPAEAIPYLERGHAFVAAANVEPDYVLGLCYMDTKRYADARKAFAAQYGFPSDSAEAYLLASRLFLRREYLPAAEESARKAIALAPRLPLAHELLGEIELASSRVPQAISDFETERAINPLYGGTYDRLGDAYTRTGDYPKAQQALDRAVLLEPNSTGPYILLGKVMLKLHEPVLAAMYLERAVRMDGSNFMAHGLLGQAYRAAGRTTDAQRETEAGEKLQADATPKFEKP